LAVSEAYFHFSADESLPEALADMPASVKSFLQRGYDVLARMDSAARMTLLEASLKALESPQEPPKGDASKLGLDATDYRAAVGAATFATLALGESRLKPNEFVSALENAGIIAGEHSGEILPFVELLIREQTRIKASLGSIRSGRAVLPTLSRIEWAADLRVRYDDADVPQLTPVGIIRFGTDHRDDELFCQATMSQLDYIMDELNKLKKRLVAVNDWKSTRTAS
jgi:hypothetical protein